MEMKTASNVSTIQGEVEMKTASNVSIIHGEEEAMDEVGFQKLVESLPKERNWFGGNFYFYQGFWCQSRLLKGIISFQQNFQALDSDIILASIPKSGTTWLKSLVFTIVNRNRFELENNPLFCSTPHSIVPFLEIDVYLGKDPSSYLENNVYSPRIFATHMPYASLPPSIKHSNCKIVYICRNPMDVFISYWHFMDKGRLENRNSISLNEGFEMYCQGIHGFGPFFNHLLGFWEAARNKEKILFLKYEDLKEDIISETKKLAEFLGFPFSKEEEEQEVVEKVVKLCSFENLKNLEVNKIGNRPFGTPNTAFFRKGVVGDWNNYLTPSMVERFENLIHEKLDNTGLSFKR